MFEKNIDDVMYEIMMYAFVMSKQYNSGLRF